MDRPGPDPRTVLWLNRIVALLHYVVAGLILYFRLGPFSRVIRRLTDQGAEIPGWFIPAFTIGPLLVMAFLIWRGTRILLRGQHLSSEVS